MRKRFLMGAGGAEPQGDRLEIVAILLVLAWLLGVASGYTWDGAIHGLAATAAMVVGIRIFGPRRS